MKKITVFIDVFATVFISFVCMVFRIDDFEIMNQIESWSSDPDWLIDDPLDIDFCEGCYVPDAKTFYVPTKKDKKRIDKLGLDLTVVVRKKFWL